MENSMNDNTVYVNMLGGFSIILGSKHIDAMGNQSKKPWNLLEYLIAFRKREIALEELIDLFWGNEDSSNPNGALKTLLFRSRKLLIPLTDRPQDYLIHIRGTYAWNPDVEIVADIDEFEDLCNHIFSTDTSTAEYQLDLCLQALDLYKGDFLPKSSWISWVIPISAYYHSLYQKLVHKTVSILKERDDFQKIIDICQHAIVIEQFDEKIHSELIYALYKAGSQQAALDHYNRTINMLYDEFAITPSDELKDLYKTIQDTKHGITTDLSIIQDSLREETQERGAFYCEYAVFKNIYQLESRAIERTGDSIYLGLVTISDSKGKLLKPSIQTRAMAELGEAICRSLRRGDAYTRYSISQYIILIPTATYENGEKVMQRISCNFKKDYTRKDLNVQCSLMALLPS